MKYHIEIKNLEDSTIEIKGELEADDFDSFYDRAITDIGLERDFPGFRKGHVPTKTVEQKVGQDKILLAMAEKAIQKLYPLIITEKNIEAIGAPEIQITKLAKNNPLGFTIKTAIIPSFPLPNYKNIAEKTLSSLKTDPLTVTEKEIDEFIDNLRRMVKKNEGMETDDDQKTESSDVLPPLDLELVKKFGDFKSIEEFKEKIKQQLLQEKTTKEKEKNRVKILEAITEEIDIKLPSILIESELDKMVAELKNQVKPMGIKFEDYLNHLKKTEMELRTAWQEDAKKRVKFGLLIQKIAQEEKIIIPASELSDHTKVLRSHYPDQNKVTDHDLSHYAQNILINEKVFELLEKTTK